MRVKPFRASLLTASELAFLSPVLQLSCVLLLLCSAQASAQTPRGRVTLPEPVRIFNIDGQVSLPNERPAARVKVRLMGRDGVNRETLTNDNGRFEFLEVPPGTYQLTAISLTDSSLVSSPVETDTARTSVGNLTVNLSLHVSISTWKPESDVIAVAEAGQNVPKEARKAFRQGLKFKDEDKTADALASFSRAIEIYPDYFQALAERGNLRISARELKDAEKDFERALALNARYEPALRGAGYCKLEGREFAQAAQYFEKATALKPSDPGTYLLLGIANLELDRRDAARESLQQALKLDPLRAIRAHIYLANLYARERRYQEAADELRIYLDAGVADPDIEEMKKVEARWRGLARPQ